MTAKHLVLGFDGADLALVLTLGRARLPNMFALMDRGVYAHQQSVEPPATLPNWTTFLTGVDPGEHGVFDFTTRRGYRVRFTAGTVREAPTWLSRLDRAGLACACLGFPATYPPERFERGVFVSGWDAPVAFEADRSFVWPREFHDMLTRRFGPLSFDEVDQFRADVPGFHARLGASLADRVARRTELASYVLAMRRWEVFAFYFGESDTASHYLWSLYDEGSPRRPARVSADESEGLPRVYEALDRALGRLVAEAGPDPEITIVSDHGSGGSSDRVLYLNRALAELGLLRFRSVRAGASGATWLKRAALTGLPPRLRERAFRAAGAALPSLLESRARFGAIDMRRTTAFSDELNYFPSVHLNVRGREPHGVVAPADVERVTREVSEALRSLSDPENGRPLIARVWRREELFVGPFVSRAPDLLLELRLDRGYSLNLMPSSEAVGHTYLARLASSAYLGKKGRSLPGSHRPRGLFVAAGPRVVARGPVEIDIAGASAFVLERLGFAAPERARSKIPAALLVRDAAQRELPRVASTAAQRGDPSALERRLRALGYVD